MDKEPASKELRVVFSIALALAWACLFVFHLLRFTHDLRLGLQENSYWFWGDLVTLLICAMLSVYNFWRAWRFIRTSVPGSKPDTPGQQQVSLNE